MTFVYGLHIQRDRASRRGSGFEGVIQRAASMQR